MAVVAAPIAAAGVGAVYFVALTKTYSSAANLSANLAFGVEDAYPWPVWRSWIDTSTKSNSTPGGSLGAVALAAVAFGVQRRFLWRHLGNSLRLPASEKCGKIRSTGQFIKAVGPGVAEPTSLSAITVSMGILACCFVTFKAFAHIDVRQLLSKPHGQGR